MRKKALIKTAIILKEKAHVRLWKRRRNMQAQLNDTYSGISNGVDCIIQDSLPMQELANNKEENNVVETRTNGTFVNQKEGKKTKEDTN